MFWLESSAMVGLLWIQLRNFLLTLSLRDPVIQQFLIKKHIFIECVCKEDYYRIWLKLKWFIDGYAMRVFKWSTDFSPKKESSIAPVWIRVESLPLYLFDERSLLSISNAIGSPIKVDSRNVNRSMLHSARICVELDVCKPLLDTILISFKDEVSKNLVEKFWVKVFYDEVPNFCSSCGHIGHGTGTCKRTVMDSVQGKAVISNAVKVIEEQVARTSSTETAAGRSAGFDVSSSAGFAVQPMVSVDLGKNEGLQLTTISGLKQATEMPGSIENNTDLKSGETSAALDISNVAAVENGTHNDAEIQLVQPQESSAGEHKIADPAGEIISVPALTIPAAQVAVGVAAGLDNTKLAAVTECGPDSAAAVHQKDDLSQQFLHQIGQDVEGTRKTSTEAGVVQHYSSVSTDLSGTRNVVHSTSRAEVAPESAGNTVSDNLGCISTKPYNKPLYSSAKVFIGTVAVIEHHSVADLSNAAASFSSGLTIAAAATTKFDQQLSAVVAKPNQEQVLSVEQASAPEEDNADSREECIAEVSLTVRDAKQGLDHNTQDEPAVETARERPASKAVVHEGNQMKASGAVQQNNSAGNDFQVPNKRVHTHKDRSSVGFITPDMITALKPTTTKEVVQHNNSAGNDFQVTEKRINIHEDRSSYGYITADMLRALKPTTTKDGYPAVIFKLSDKTRYLAQMARGRTRDNRE